MVIFNFFQRNKTSSLKKVVGQNKECIHITYKEIVPLYGQDYVLYPGL